MKKLLFPLILTVTGNTFTAKRLKVQEIQQQAEYWKVKKKEIEEAVQKETKPFADYVINFGITEARRNIGEEAFEQFFEKDYIISDVLKKEIGKWQVEDLGYTNTFNYNLWYNLVETKKQNKETNMKKILFVIMLAAAGNILASNRSIAETIRREKEEQRAANWEKKEIEYTLQRDLQDFFYSYVNAVIGENEKKLEKQAYNNLFDRNYIVSNSLKREIAEKYVRELAKEAIKESTLRFEAKQINHISENKVDVVFDIKARNLTRAANGLAINNDIIGRVVERARFGSVDELERIMKRRGNEPAKRNFYNVALEELVSRFAEEIKNVTDEDVILDDLPATLQRVNGKWKVINPVVTEDGIELKQRIQIPVNRRLRNKIKKKTSKYAVNLVYFRGFVFYNKIIFEMEIKFKSHSVFCRILTGFKR